MSGARLAVATIVMMGLPLAACGFGGPDTAATTTTVAPAPVTYVAIGGAATADRDVESVDHASYPRILFRDQLPSQTVFTDLAERGSDLADVVDRQVATALELEPTVVTVWVDDEMVHAGPRYEDPAQAVRSAVQALLDAGATVAVTSGASPSAEWDAAVQSIAEETDAVLVDLAGARDAADMAQRIADALGLGP